MKTLTKYLLPLLTGFLLGIIFMLKRIKPVINADTYIESMEQRVNKLKQKGTNNEQTTKGSINIEPGRGEGEALSNREERKAKRQARREERRNNRK